jgi:general stress protein YciG
MKAEIKEYLAKIGRKGGGKTSEEKALAARENGKKGGRPRKKKA